MKAALVAIGRLENDYAREFVEHHLAVGFDKVIIYDNNHRGEEHFETVLKDHIDIDNVGIVPFRDRERAQRDAYNDAYARFSDEYDWLAFFDFDEFLCLPDKESPRKVKDFLQSIPQDFQVVMIPWLIMTDNGLVRYDGRPLMERFKEYLVHPSTLGKCIVRTGIQGLRFVKSVHVPSTPTLRCCTPLLKPTKQSNRQPQDTSVAYLKHFSTKTIEEWMNNKMKKGAAGITYAKFKEQYKDYFFRFNERTAEKEEYIKNLKQ